MLAKKGWPAPLVSGMSPSSETTAPMIVFPIASFRYRISGDAALIIWAPPAQALVRAFVRGVFVRVTSTVPVRRRPCSDRPIEQGCRWPEPGEIPFDVDRNLWAWLSQTSGRTSSVSRHIKDAGSSEQTLRTERELQVCGAVDSPVGSRGRPEGDDLPCQNIVFSLAACSGMGCSTSQCSTILPFS